MATKLPRLNVVMEPYIYNAIEKLAKKEDLSLSLVAKELIREALLINEDTFWTYEAKAREKTFKRKDALSHKDMWK